MKNKSGYSLIELTIVVGLISILSIAISAIVLTTTINSNRIKTQVRVRQTGDFAIGQIETIIRNSLNIVSCDSSGETVTLKNPDNQTTQLYFSLERIASNSGTYLTPADTQVSSFNVTCLPSDSSPQLVQVTFNLGRSDDTNQRSLENPVHTFSTSAEPRND